MYDVPIVLLISGGFFWSNNYGKTSPPQNPYALAQDHLVKELPL